MSVSSGTDVILAAKLQSALGTPASGAGGTIIEVRPGAGLQRNVASIESAILRRSGQKLKQRQGSITAVAAYETELRVGNLDLAFMGALGCTVTAPLSLSQTDYTSLAISGTGTIITGASGSFISLGLIAGMMIKLGGMSTTANNSVWVPVLAVTASTLTVPSGYLTDQAADTTCTLVTAKCFKTPTPRLKQYYTIDQYLSSIDRSMLGTDMVFNSLNFNAAPNAPVLAGFGLTGLGFSVPLSAASPTLTSPSDPSASGILSMLDGALYRNGVAAVGLTGLTMGLSSQATVTPLLSSRTGADVGLTGWTFAGQLTGLVQDFTELESSIAEDLISLFALFSDNEADPADFVSVYVGNASYGQSNTPIADGDLIQTTTIYAGEDTRGAGYAASTMVISTSAA